MIAFQPQLELLHAFLARRAPIVERIQGVLNAQRKPLEYLRDHSLLSRQFEDGFFIGMTESQSRLRGQLEDAHWAGGFKPRHLPGLHNGLIDPGEMIVRGFHLWQQTRWPGRNGRIHYAHTLFNVYVIRCLTLLSVRLWDDGALDAGNRLSQLQHLLDQLWKGTPADQPVLMRDARWLIPMAQSPATEELGAYFDVAHTISSSLSDADRIEIHKAGVRMAGGHLRSQIRYYCTKNAVPLRDESVTRNTRNSNALDFALLIQDLVPLLEAYERACGSEDRQARLDLADAICQGISPDPELFLNRIELLGAYSMIEHLFVTSDNDGHAAYTAMGQRHVRLFKEYEARIGRVATSLAEDCSHFRPVAGAYSPYGVLYGFSSDLVEHMALKALQPDAVTRFALEDVFASGDTDGEKLAWVTGWRKLPHISREMAKLFEYPQQFAEEIFDRIEHALRERVSERDVQTGRLFILPSDDPGAGATHRAESYDEAQLLSDRREGRCLLSYKTSGGWMAVSKNILTDVLGAGHDVTVALPQEVAATLRLVAPGLTFDLRPSTFDL